MSKKKNSKIKNASHLEPEWNTSVSKNPQPKRTCIECDRAIENPKMAMSFRWGEANCKLLACRKHGQEILEAISDKRREMLNE